ncbi:hypothetical protein [Bacillus thuringiensis]|uniref:hypothetical protein n=1 Tax=Bacillus thuringiensis TaxID=1428 RepID=UPI00300DCAE6
MIKLESSEQLKGTYENKKYDFDRYNFVERTAFSTKEISVVVDFERNEITGDKIAYGSCHDLELKACIQLLKMLQSNGVKRDFNKLIM